MKEEKEKQIIEVEYDKKMVKEDIKAQKKNDEKLLVQDTFNEDSIEDMSTEDSEIEVIE